MAPSLSYSSFVGSSKLRREVKQTASREGTHRSASRFVTVARKHATHLFCDGSCRQPDGASGIGVVVKYNNGRTVWHASKRLTGKKYGSAEVEYEAVLYGLRFCKSLAGNKSALVMTDNKSVIDHLNNKTGIKNKNIANISQQVKSVAGTLPDVEFRRIERGQNKPANTLARDASGDGRVEHDFEKNNSKLVKNE